MIYFFVGNNDGIGGMQNLFLNIADELFKQEIETRIIANANSYIADVLSDNNKKSCIIDLKSIEVLNKNFDLFKDIIIISGNVTGLEVLKTLNPRILIWNVFPESFIDANRIRLFHIKYFTRKLLKYLYSHNSIVFMDKFCYDTNDKIYSMNYNNGEIIVPIPITTKENYFVKRKLIEYNNIKISYLGRASDFKYYPLLRLVVDLIRITNDFNFNFELIIITDIISYYKDKLACYSDKINITYQEGLYGDTLDDFLISNSNIHFAMGTSCLEGAKLGIPSVLIDYGYNEFPENYQYKWLFNVQGYILGENIISLKFEGPNNLKLIIDDYIKNKEFISSQTYEYITKYHSISPITKKFLLHCENSKGRLNNFYNLCLVNNPLIHFINSINISF